MPTETELKKDRRIRSVAIEKALELIGWVDKILPEYNVIPKDFWNRKIKFIDFAGKARYISLPGVIIALMQEWVLDSYWSWFNKIDDPAVKRLDDAFRTLFNARGLPYTEDSAEQKDFVNRIMVTANELREKAVTELQESL
jgi:hypothetical protein